MSRISQLVVARKAADEKLLIPYLMAGDPSLDTTIRLMHSLVASGADIIELGMPFSDPASDGPVIQAGSDRALAAGTSINDVLQVVARFRSTDTQTPVVLMGYLNPIEAMGYETFADAAAKAGVDGLLIVDLPPAEAEGLSPLLRSRDIDTIFLVAPTTSPDRAQDICEHCSGYLYYVSLKGVTGAALLDTESVAQNIGKLRQLTDLPIVIGFGIKDSDSAKAMSKLADGIVIGSALVERIACLQGQAQIEDSDLENTVAIIAEARLAIDSDA